MDSAAQALGSGRVGLGDTQAAVLFPQVLPLLQIGPLDGLTLLSCQSEVNQKLQWKKFLVKLLPTRTQCDILLTYFVEHINWVFQTVHIPSFRKEYSQFWDGSVDEVNLIWLSLLFTILSISGLYIPISAIEFVGIQGDSIRKLAHLWHHGSSQALQAGNFETNPCLTQLQTFTITQLYWYATNNIEILNSRMAQAIRQAQILGLDRDHLPSKNVHDEMRHRIWWDLVDSDTFQSICLDRQPLIRVQFAKVPLPQNCHDSDLGDNFITPRSLEEPTAMSMNIYRAQVFQLINNALMSEPDQLQSYEAVVGLDRQLRDLMEQLPWYFQLDNQGNPKLFSGNFEFLSWQHHILRTCVSTQQVRMYRAFLSDSSKRAQLNCARAVEDALAVYRSMRSAKSFQAQQKFFPQAYQVFSVAVTLVTLLLVERASVPDPAAARRDVETMAADLALLEAQECGVPVAVNGRKVLLTMLSLLEQGEQCSPDDTERLVPSISVILGGETSTREYLGRRVESPTAHIATTPGVDDQSGHAGEPLDDEARLAQSTIQDIGPSVPLGELTEGTDMMFDYADLQLEDSYDLFSWDMTGLLSDAAALSRARGDWDEPSISLS
ncbi:hypothetical protein B0A52_07887 [Exophiala mesophila]|uniref:Xylanolytic transcriptional activator regulatory domain-containing protein n=1 Tax=Exophiala mesophila TaxID=212818 RepID=A0A438MXT9_EXOME|nr:hypothetical protein B0A52_07887 [Exophiala mesophila]